MHLDHIVAAIDQSEAGRAALRAASTLAERAGGRVTALGVEPILSGVRLGNDGSSYLKSMLEPMEGQRTVSVAVGVAVRHVLPGVEIGRFAEEAEAGLVVVGRKQRSRAQRLFLGDTADEVARRSRLPCLSVRAGGGTEFDRVLASLDGSERGMSVLFAALELTRCTNGRLRVISVEPRVPGETQSEAIPTTKSARLAQSIDQIRLEENVGYGSWDTPGPAGDSPLVIRRGQVVEEILSEVGSFGADVLVIGYHRGGPAGVIEAGSIARRLLHQAECAVLTVPL